MKRYSDLTKEEIREYARKKYQEYKAKDPEYIKKKHRNSATWNIDIEKRKLREKKYREKNKGQAAIKRKEYLKNNPEKVTRYHARVRELHKEYRKNPKYLAKKAAHERNRFSKKINATPEWLTSDQLKEIENFYLEAKRLEASDGTKRHVDHIIPLQGKDICGLHVPWNLQILTASENFKKSNKLITERDRNDA